jgi:hypothetical protein
MLDHPAIWRARDALKRQVPAQPTRHVALDGLLPGGGWPVGVLSEILLPQPGFGEMALLAPMLAERCGLGHRIVFVHPPMPPYAPALAQMRIDLSRVLWLDTANTRDALWSAEQVLASRTPAVVLIWAEADERALRRLALAVEGSQSIAILFRSPTVAANVSPAALRLCLEAPWPDGPLKIIKARGLSCSVAQPICVAP